MSEVRLLIQKVQLHGVKKQSEATFSAGEMLAREPSFKQVSETKQNLESETSRQKHWACPASCPLGSGGLSGCFVFKEVSEGSGYEILRIR